MSLGKDYFVKRTSAEVSPPPDGERFVPMVKISDDRRHVWGTWGAFPQVTRLNEAVEPWCLEAATVRYEFGPANDLVGSMVYGLRVLAIEDSKPAGAIDSLSRFEIVGWAFDPIAPLRILDVQVYVDSELHSAGKTGVQRPDIVSQYSLPPNAQPGFVIPLALSGAPSKVKSIHIEWPGVYRRERSETLSFWSMQPPGQFIDVSPAAATGFAYLVDFPAEFVVCLLFLSLF